MIEEEIRLKRLVWLALGGAVLGVAGPAHADDTTAPTGRLYPPANPVIVAVPVLGIYSEAIVGEVEDVGLGVARLAIMTRSCSATSATVYGPPPISFGGTCSGANELPTLPGTTGTQTSPMACSVHRDHCNFLVYPPESPGVYELSGTVTDRAGNQGAIPPIVVNVV